MRPRESFRYIETPQNGRFRFAHLTPGDYKVYDVAADASPLPRWKQHVHLSRYKPAGKITVQVGSEKTLVGPNLQSTGVHMTKSGLALSLSVSIVLLSLPALSQGADRKSAASHASQSEMLTVPTCPAGGSQQFTRNLQIIYVPGEGGAIQNPQSLTLRLVFNGRSWRDNDRTVAFQRRDDRSWQASVPLSFQWVYAIW